MTSIKLTVTGAEIWASVTGILTSGMVGIPVTIEYDASWDGLRKNLVCRCGRQDSREGECRAILDVEGAATVAHEVMQPDMFLYLGVEGYSSDGKLVLPTRWAECGRIHRGANTEADVSADPTLPIWEQIQTAVEQIRDLPLTEVQMTELLATVQTAVDAASSAEQSDKRAASASSLAVSSADAARSAADSAQAAMECARTSADSAAELANETFRLKNAAEAAAQRAEAAGSPTGGALNAEQVSALDGLFQVCAFTVDASAQIAAFRAAFGLDSAPDVPDQPDEPDEPDVPEPGVEQQGSVLSIVSGVTANQNGTVLTIT